MEEKNRTSEIIERLSKKENRGKTLLNVTEKMKAISELNSEMEEVRRDFKIKNQKSNISASKIILTS